MKEKYFDKKDIAREAKKYLDSLRWKKSKDLNKLDFSRAALLVLDMQEYFLDIDSHAYIPSAKAIIPKILKLQEYFLNKDNQVVQTRHVNSRDNAGMMNEWWGHLMSRDDPRIKILSELQDRRVRILEKTQYDAFYQTGLFDFLKENMVKHLFITGVMTHLCVETTVRSAFVRGFEVFLVVDGTATYNREFFQSSLINLSHGFSYPVLSKDILVTSGPKREK